MVNEWLDLQILVRAVTDAICYRKTHLFLIMLNLFKTIFLLNYCISVAILIKFSNILSL